MKINKQWSNNNLTSTEPYQHDIIKRKREKKSRKPTNIKIHKRSKTVKQTVVNNNQTKQKATISPHRAYHHLHCLARPCLPPPSLKTHSVHLF